MSGFFRAILHMTFHYHGTHRRRNPLVNSLKGLTLSFPGTCLGLVLTFDHNYANTGPILTVQRPITFHLGSLERVCKVLRRYSNSSQHGVGYKIVVSDVDPLLFFGIFFFTKITHHTLTKNTASMTNPSANHGTIGPTHPKSQQATHCLTQFLTLIPIL